MRRPRVGCFGFGARRSGAGAPSYVCNTRVAQYNNSEQSTRPQMSDLVLVLTTMPDDSRADELARSLVDERLAACVNVHGPMVSTYRWKGQVEREAERQLVIKTTRARLADLEARLRALHPYDVPEFVVIDADSSAAYAAWAAEATRSDHS
jgi:periplasmic divalent cation tolerance protein